MLAKRLTLGLLLTVLLTLPLWCASPASAESGCHRQDGGSDGTPVRVDLPRR